MFDDSILEYGKILFCVLVGKGFLFFVTKLMCFVSDISVFDFDDIFFVLVNGGKELSFDFDEVFSDFVLVQEADLFLEDKVYV